MNNSQRREEMYSTVQTEAIFNELVPRGAHEPMCVLTTDRLETGALKTTTVVYITRCARGERV